MPLTPLPVLLLGWNGAPRSGEPVPALAPVVDSLAATTALEVVLPHLPAAPLPQGAHTHVISLGSFTPEEIRRQALPAPRRPAAWRRPAAPYTGTANTASDTAYAATPAEGPAGRASGTWSGPAAPYLGATPPTSEAIPAAADLLTATPATSSPLAATAPLAEPAAPASAPAEQTASPLPSVAAVAPEAPAAAPQTPQELPAAAPDESEPAAGDEPVHGLLAGAHATLPDALAVLNLDLAPEADLNFQVIQYARFATRQALQDSFSVIYAPDWPTWLAALEIRQQTGRPLVLHVHSLAQERATAADRGWALELERLALRRADLVLAASDELAHRLRVRYQLPPERLHLVPASDTDALQRVLQQFENRLPGRPATVPFFPPTP